MVELIESGETLDEGFGLIRNRVPVQTLEFNFGVGEGRVVRTKRCVAAEEHVGDDGQCRNDESGGACRKTRDTHGPDVDGFSAAGFFENFRGDIAKGAGEGGELLVGGMEAFWAVKDEQRRGRWTGTWMPKSTMTMSLSGSFE